MSAGEMLGLFVFAFLCYGIGVAAGLGIGWAIWA